MRRAVLSLLVATALPIVACGPGPTEGPKQPEPPPLASLSADAGLTTAAANGPDQEAADAERERAREQIRFAEERRKAEAAAADVGGDAGPDPMNGQFTLAQATAGLAGSGPMIATIRTSKGDMRCKLFEDKAPIAVANFVGLARGARPWKSGNQWVTRPAYDGTTFHRVIKGFMIQGGDPQGTGRGEPGYVFKDELWPGAKHDRAGLLCMANRGPDTNGMQFFITDAGAPHLDKSYTIFGECSPTSVVHAIANVPTDPGDRPQQTVSIDKVEITRGGAGGASAAPAGGARAPAASTGAAPASSAPAAAPAPAKTP